MQGVFTNIDEYNLGKKRKVLIVFDDVIANMISNKKLNSIVRRKPLEGENLTFHLLLLCNHNLKYQKKIYILCSW